MNEDEITRQLRQNITAPPDNVLTATVQAPVDATNGQATTESEYPLDEMTQYKLHDYFGEYYKDSNEVKRQQAQYIYDEVAKTLEDKQYGFVVAKIRDMERVIGTTNSENRLYKLYQWMKLDKMRRNVEAEQGALSNG